MKAFKIITVAALLGVSAIAYAQTAPNLTVRVIAPASVAAGSAQKIATIQLSANGDVWLSSLPVATSGNVSNCSLEQSDGTALDPYSFAQPLHVAGGSVYNLAYVCDAGNGTATISVNAANVAASTASGTTTPATVSSTQSSATVVVGSGVTNTAPATTTTGTTGTGSQGSVTTPGIPNTGEGGEAPMTLTILALAALVAVGAGIYTLRTARR